MENQNFVNGNKIGTRVNYVVNGTMYTKEFGDGELANEFYRTLLEIKKDPTDTNIEKLIMLASRKAFVTKVDGFVLDPETDEVYMEGFEHTPVPQVLIDVVEDYIENGFDTTAIRNFWKLLMANPDKRVRKDLFGFISQHDFSITDQGYMIVYKAVARKNDVAVDLASFVSNNYIKVRKDWNTTPKKYVVYKEFADQDQDEFEYKMTKKVTFNSWDLDEKNVELVGSLDDLQSRIDELIEGDNTAVYTDLHTKKMEIRLGVPVQKPRSECNGDPKIECSYGLHVGATKYVQNFGYADSPILVCLVNPMNVVAVPDYDNSKMRVCEYYPMGVATYEDRKIDVIQQSFFPYDYIAHEEEELAELLRTNEYDDLRAMNSSRDKRSADDYAAILEARVVDLSTMSREE